MSLTLEKFVSNSEGAPCEMNKFVWRPFSKEKWREVDGNPIELPKARCAELSVDGGVTIIGRIISYVAEMGGRYTPEGGPNIEITRNSGKPSTAMILHMTGENGSGILAYQT